MRTLDPVINGPLVISALSAVGENPNINAGYLSLVIPTYNERENIEELVHQLCGILDTLKPNQYELIVVDDDSPDRTWEAAQTLTVRYPSLKVFRRQKERGLATAVIRGWQMARGDILGVIDADLQHPTSVLPKLLAAIQSAGLAVASRHIEGGGVSNWHIFRRIVSRTAQVLGLLILPEVIGRVSDPMSGYFLVRRSVIEGKPLNPMGYKILIEVLARGDNRKISEVGYVFVERRKNVSKAGPKIYAEYIAHLFTLRFSLWPVKQFLSFCLVGFSGVFIDMAVFYLLSDPTRLDWGITRSKIIAAELAMFNNFIWNDAWTFRSTAATQRKSHFFKRFLKFNAICLAGLCVNVLVLNALFNFFYFNRYTANLIAILVTTFWNFYINYKLNWRVTAIEK